MNLIKWHQSSIKDMINKTLFIPISRIGFGDALWSLFCSNFLLPVQYLKKKKKSETKSMCECTALNTWNLTHTHARSHTHAHTSGLLWRECWASSQVEEERADCLRGSADESVWARHPEPWPAAQPTRSHYLQWKSIQAAGEESFIPAS